MTTDYLLILDLESNGVNDERDMYAALLEVGFVLVDATTPDLVEKGRGDAVVRPYGDRAQLDRMWAVMPDVVQRMHSENGLWEEATTNADMTPHAAELDTQLRDWLNAAVGPDATVMLAGSGVGHFDDRWMRTWLPLLRARLVYANLDSSSIRRALKLAGREGLVRQAKDVEAKPHRALADAVLHTDELRYYLRLLQHIAPAPV